MKIRMLLHSYFQLFLQDFLYLTMLFSIIVFGMTAEHLLGISSVKKYSLLLIGMFFLSLLSTMNLYHNDSKQNKYLKQKINNSWLDSFCQFLVALIINIFSGILIFIFSLILNQDVLFDLTGILSLISVGMLGSGIATLFQTQWYRHSSLGQIGTLVLVYLAFSGSVISILSYADWIMPPLSKMIVILKRDSQISQLLPVAAQAFLYALILFVISGFLYREKKKS